MKQSALVFGMHRSGPSAIRVVLNTMGLDFGSNLMPADDDNQKGYFENMFVFELNRRILEENNFIRFIIILILISLASLRLLTMLVELTQFKREYGI